MTRSMIRPRLAGVTLATVLLPTLTILSAEVPYGHPDFVPTAERPIGFQADGNGHLPGASLVSEFWDGRPRWGEVAYLYQAKPATEWRYADQTPKNILWKIALPGWTYAQPIPVKGRLYGIAEPDWVWCADQVTGKILWQQRVTMASCDPALAGKPEEQAKRQELYDIGRAVHFLNNPFRMAHGGNAKRKGMIWHPAMSPQAPYVAQALALYRKMRQRVETLDPDPKILAAFDEEIEYVETYQRGDIDALVEAGFLSRHGADGKQIKGGKRAGVSAADPENSGVVGWAICAKYRIPLKSLFWGWTPGTVSVPASDGERIFVCMATGQIVALDLDGKRLWSHYDPFGQKFRVEHWASPLVVGDLVLIRGTPQKGNVRLVAYRAATGERLWEQLVPNGGHGVWQTPLHLHVPGSTPRDLIVWHNRIIDLKDGSIASSNIPDTNGRACGSGGDTLVGRDGSFSILGSEHLISCRWTVPSQAGEVEPRLDFAWDGLYGPTLKGNRQLAQGITQVLFADAPVLFANGATWDWNTGRVLGMVKDKRDCSRPSVIGRTAITWGGFARDTVGRMRADAGAQQAVQLFDLTDVRHPRLQSDWNLIGGAELPKDIIFDTWLPGVDKLGLWLTYQPGGQWYGAGSFTGLPSWLIGGQCAPLAQGERTFVQTSIHLYCIGPAVKGTASDDAAVVATIRAATSMDEVVKHLEGNSAQYRYEAVRKVSGFGVQVSGRGDGKLGAENDVSSPTPDTRHLTPLLERLALEDAYEEIRAAAIVSLDRLEAGSGTALLTQALTAHAGAKFNDRRPEIMQATALALTCNRLGAAADAAMVQALKAAPVNVGPLRPRARLLAIFARARTCGPLVEAACLEMISAPADAKLQMEALAALDLLAHAGKVAKQTEAITKALEARLPLAAQDAPWKAVDDCMDAGQHARLIPLLGRLLENPKSSLDLIAEALRRIESQGKTAAAVKPTLETLKTRKFQNFNDSLTPWIERIQKGME